jgi:hypothetical protein
VAQVIRVPALQAQSRVQTPDSPKKKKKKVKHGSHLSKKTMEAIMDRMFVSPKICVLNP